MTDRIGDRFVVALTGASGAHYGLRLVWQLSFIDGETDLIVSPGFAKVLEAEQGFEGSWHSIDDLFALITSMYGAIGGRHRFDFCGYGDISARAASGSAAYRAMIIAPCSMKTLAAIAHGLSQNLIERAADVSLKERRTLIVCPRETPLSLIHIENMLALTKAGAMVMPLMPGYYHMTRGRGSAARTDAPLAHDHMTRGQGSAARTDALLADDQLKSSPATDALDELADFMIDRIFQHAGINKRIIRPWRS